MKVYIGATRQNDGKTITCLGLIAAMKKRFSDVGYMKPVGQRFQEIDGHKVDEDAVLVKEVYDLKCDLVDMSPIAVPRYFTENYIDNPRRNELVQEINQSYERIAQGKSIVLVEGTGHAGVGAVFDLSNGDVASMLGCKVIIVTSGGIGRPIDEVMLNKAMFDAFGVEIAGVIVNKVDEEKYDKVKDYVTRGLARKGLEVIGVMPYRPMLSNPTLEHLLAEIDGEMISAASATQTIVSKMVVGAMPTSQAFKYMSSDALLITPGTREDLIRTAMGNCVVAETECAQVAGIILTGGTPPKPTTMEMIKRSQMPVILVQDDTYTVASKIAKLVIKIGPGDSEKIQAAEALVEEYVDIDRLLEKLRNVS